MRRRKKEREHNSEDNAPIIRLFSSAVERSPYKGEVGGAAPSRATKFGKKNEWKIILKNHIMGM